MEVTTDGDIMRLAFIGFAGRRLIRRSGTFAENHPHYSMRNYYQETERDALVTLATSDSDSRLLLHRGGGGGAEIRN